MDWWNMCVCVCVCARACVRVCVYAKILTWVILNTEQEYNSHSCDIHQQGVKPRRSENEILLPWKPHSSFSVGHKNVPSHTGFMPCFCLSALNLYPGKQVQTIFCRYTEHLCSHNWREQGSTDLWRHLKSEDYRVHHKMGRST